MTSSFTSCGAPSEHAAILPVVLGSQQSGLPDWAMALIRGSELVDMPESARASSSTSAQPECPTTPPLASRGGTPRAATQLTIAIAGNVNRGTGTDGGDMGSHAHSVPDTEIHSFSPTPAPPPRTATLRYAAGPPTPSEKQFGGPSRHLQDLNAGLASNAWRRAFAQFLTKEFCTESLLFVRAVDCFKETADDALFPSVAERDAASIRRANFIAAHFLVEATVLMVFVRLREPPSAPNRLLTLDLDEGIEPDPANAGRTTSAVLNAAEAALEAHLGSPVAQTRPIPRMIHQQWKSALVPESHTAWVTAFRKIEGYTHLLWTDADLAVFVRKYFPRHEKLYHALPKPILRADLARYMLLYVFGGIYSDLDTSPIKHPDLWLEHRTPTAGRSNESTSGSRFDDEPVRLVVGIEADSPRWRSMCFARRVQFCQWTMASVPRHPALQRILRLALSMLDHLIGLGRSVSVLQTTGPGPWTDALMHELRAAGVEEHHLFGLEQPLRAGNAVVLPITAFSPGMGHMGSKPINDSAACVEHHFAGSWKDGLSSVRCFLGILE
ncbi:membrane-bound alpha-1,6-mannosyltransferase Initiation-specific [Polyrhizophydium stewartii]|uniref:Membrane-bound alpha-1,6-mannosyltransferase Initiation-specific n=1 Tax=Polyrhizophydium stewartii TaxID=2732419 RepID=A0ABR4NKW6_9FUNG